MKPRAPEEETVLIRKEVGYAWSYSYELGPSGDRQKTYVCGNEDTLLRALTQLRKVKAEVLELSRASFEELIKPPGYEAYERKKEEPLY